jgi:ubiquinone/menaquinone biosynthesis C-methylase UbiE
MGYDLSEIPNTASGSFAGCGNPVALAGLKQGEVVLDLGSGAGLDAFVAARRVGKTGRVIGVDMTPKMLASARRSAAEMGLANIEFREGDIEDLPVKDNSIDVVISNCVINLAPDKAKVFKESYRVLRPGGRLMVSDIVLNEELSEEDRNNIAKYTGCLAGAILEDKYLNYIRNAGFEKVSVVEKEGWGQAVSARIEAFKPKV